MATDRKLSEFAHDLDLYYQVAEILMKGPTSLRDIAERLGISSVSVVSTCIRRLEDEYGKTLVCITSTSGHNTLTPEGQWLFNSGGEALEKLKTVRRGDSFQTTPTLRVAASHLLLIYVLPDFARKYLNSPEGRGKNIAFNDACKYEDTLDLIYNGRSDFALAWDFVGRKSLANAYDFLHYDIFSNAFDVVVVCRDDHRFAKDPDGPVRIQDLAKERVFVLHDHHQPFREILPLPAEGGSRIEFEDYSTIIANVRMGIDGVALVPGVYRELDYYQKQGTLIHIPVEHKGERLKMRLAGIYKVEKKGSVVPVMEKYSLNFYNMIKDYFNDPANILEPGWRTPARAPELLPDTLDLTKYGQAYFMALRSKGKVTVPEWHWARIDWERSGAGLERRGKLTVLSPRDNTALYESYTLTTESVIPARLPGDDNHRPASNHVYCLVAKPIGRAITALPVVITFHMKFKVPAPEGEEEAIYGFWYGVDTENKPMIGPFILAARRPQDARLPHSVIATITRLGMLRVSTNHVDRPAEEECQKPQLNNRPNLTRKSSRPRSA
jgi:DNA-binding transcriptional LysR family regulator